jgi:hypothetical protein
MTWMTWGEYKQMIESAGITDDRVIEGKLAFLSIDDPRLADPEGGSELEVSISGPKPPTGSGLIGASGNMPGGGIKEWVNPQPPPPSVFDRGPRSDIQ